MMTLLGISTDALPAQGRGPSAIHAGDVRMERVLRKRMITGDVRASRRADLATQEQGLLVELKVREGDQLSAGDIIGRLDDRRLRIQLDEARRDHDVLEAIVAERRAEADRVTSNTQAILDAYERGAANPREARDAEADRTIAEARVAQATQNALMATSAVELLETRVEDMVIRAPFDGMVLKRHAEIGEWVGEGDALVELLSIQELEVWLSVPQEHLSAVRDMKDPVELRFDSTSEVRATRDVTILPSVDLLGRTFETIVRFRNDGTLAPGMSVVAWVPTQQTQEVITVPKSAILHADAGPYVYVVRAGSADAPMTAEFTSIDILYPLEGRMAVRSPVLMTGDRVVVEGNERLFPNAPITVAESPTAAGATQRETP
jgi:RND family efflux transporter MFP subunit